MPLDPVAENLLLCRACRTSLGAACADGTVCRCPRSGKGIHLHVLTGDCPLQKLLDVASFASDGHDHPRGGVGSELVKLIERAGLEGGACFCDARAYLLDRAGPKWCEENLDTVVAWLKDGWAMQARAMEFDPDVAAWFVRQAIEIARGKESAVAAGSTTV